MNNSVDFIQGNKYYKTELLFFIGLCFLIPILSDLEYAYYQEPTHFYNGSYPVSIIRRLIWGSFRIIPYYLFYKLAIEGILIKKRYYTFIVWFIAFVSFLDLYGRFMYNCISLMWFLPDEILRETNKVLKKPYTFHFNINYMLKEMVLMSGLAYFINYREQEAKISALKALQIQSDLDNLKLQIQPHFFFNTLNNIYSLALQNSLHTAPMVAKLAEMMRYVLYETLHNKVALKKEVAFLQNYISVQSIRYDELYTISFDTQGIDETAQIEPLLLLPFIENTFKHGLETELENGFIEMVICLNGNELTLTTCNKKSNNTKQKKGIGIENTQKRLSLLYPNKHSIFIEDNNNLYKLTLTIFLSSHD
jgi:sensor histidine kinase YesM